MICFKNLRLTVWNKNKNSDWSNIVFTDESSFIFIIQELIYWLIKKKKQHCCKKHTLKACMEAYWSMGTISLDFLKETWVVRNILVYQKTIYIQLKRCFQKLILQW